VQRAVWRGVQPRLAHREAPYRAGRAVDAHRPGGLVGEILAHVARRLDGAHREEACRGHRDDHEVAMLLEQPVAGEGGGVLLAELAADARERAGESSRRHELVGQHFDPHRIGAMDLGVAPHDALQARGAVGLVRQRREMRLLRPDAVQAAPGLDQAGQAAEVAVEHGLADAGFLQDFVDADVAQTLAAHDAAEGLDQTPLGGEALAGTFAVGFGHAVAPARVVAAAHAMSGRLPVGPALAGGRAHQRVPAPRGVGQHLDLTGHASQCTKM
jgi:hypothetical protein